MSLDVTKIVDSLTYNGVPFTLSGGEMTKVGSFTASATSSTGGAYGELNVTLPTGEGYYYCSIKGTTPTTGNRNPWAFLVFRKSDESVASLLIQSYSKGSFAVLGNTYWLVTDNVLTIDGINAYRFLNEPIYDLYRINV